MDSCSYHVCLGSIRTIPFLEGSLSFVEVRESGITCGSVWGFIAPIWVKDRTAGLIKHQNIKENCNDYKCNYNTRWIFLKLLMKGEKLL